MLEKAWCSKSKSEENLSMTSEVEFTIKYIVQ